MSEVKGEGRASGSDQRPGHGNQKKREGGQKEGGQREGGRGSKNGGGGVRKIQHLSGTLDGPGGKKKGTIVDGAPDNREDGTHNMKQQKRSKYQSQQTQQNPSQKQKKSRNRRRDRREKSKKGMEDGDASNSYNVLAGKNSASPTKGGTDGVGVHKLGKQKKQSSRGAKKATYKVMVRNLPAVDFSESDFLAAFQQVCIQLDEGERIAASMTLSSYIPGKVRV